MLDRLKALWTPAGTGPTSFLPAEYVRERAESRANVLSLILFGTVLIAVVSAFFVTNRAWASVRARQAEINAQYTEQTKKIELLQQLEKQKAQMLDRAEVTTALIERVPRSILLAEIVNRVPEGVTLTDFNLNGKRIQEAPKPADKNAKRSLSSKSKSKDAPKEEAPRPRPPRMEFTIQISGLSPQDESVADFQASLKQCGLLDTVDLVSSQETAVDGLSMRKFRVEARLRPDADARSITPLRLARKGAEPVITANEPAGDAAPGGRIGSMLKKLLGSSKPVASGADAPGTAPSPTGER
jgi:Tfp pilus assembly protein PilN